MLDVYTVAWVLSPWVQCTWGDNDIAPNVLFVSRAVRTTFLECFRQCGGVARYPCAVLVYELHVAAPPERHPGVPPALPMYWIVDGGVGTPARVPCTSLWSQSRADDSDSRLHEDARDALPSVHDGSTCAYDFDALLDFAGFGSLARFYADDVVPICETVVRLVTAEATYRVFTHIQGRRRLMRDRCVLALRRTTKSGCISCADFASDGRIAHTETPHEPGAR